jgi:class 3 adenylate cyclase
MPRIPIFRLGRSEEEILPPKLTSYTPELALQGLQLGVDNLRYDVLLSPRFTEQVRLQITNLLVRHGSMEGMLAAEAPREQKHSAFAGGPDSGLKRMSKSGPAELKPLLNELHVAALNRAKSADNPSVDLLARVAIIKFLRAELNTQFAQLLERGRAMLKNYEGIRQQKALEYRERMAGFQVAKKIILRKAGQDLFRILREIEKETLARMRRSLFGEGRENEYQLFLNPLIFTEDGGDAYLNAEHYVMLGNYDRDPDRFSNVRRAAVEFFRSLGLPESERDPVLDGWLNAPENAQELVGGSTPDEATHQGRSQKTRLDAWVDVLEREKVMEYVLASYEVVPLLAEYSPRVNAQQLKNALISREERMRVEKLIEEHGKLSCETFYAATARVAGCRGGDRARMAGRFLRDFLRYHRDTRRLETLNSALDAVSLVSNEKLRELSAMNGTLYEFLLPEEQKPAEEKVLRHVILKADVRDSSRLTRSLLERDMNPASYFSLNFYGPVNKLLAKYGAHKVFLEGDAIILALLEHEGEACLAVARACVLAREMIEIVCGYNQLLERAGLPSLELGIGISFQDSSPMYLMDGEQRIMISDALNESDRLSACSKRVRKAIESMKTPFNVYLFQTVKDADSSDSPDDFLMKYNLNGIRMSEAAFGKLEQELSLEPCKLDLPELWGSENFKLYSALVPIGNDIFRRIVLRSSHIPQIDPQTFSLKEWTDGQYYEVCANPAIYAMLEANAKAGK